jgi:hypothetical protein
MDKYFYRIEYYGYDADYSSDILYYTEEGSSLFAEEYIKNNSDFLGFNIIKMRLNNA